MEEKKLGVIFGGMSTENEVSVVSANSILNNLDKEKYEIYPIYIGKDGTWYEYTKKSDVIQLGQLVEHGKEIENVMKYLKNLDIIFPVLHGLYGEDGTIQGMLEILGIPYVGCGVFASSVGMDKIYTKILFEKAEIPQTPYVYVKNIKDNYVIIDEKFDEEEFEIKKITDKIKFPMFVKPSNSGSSVGVKKSTNIEELKLAIENAGHYDNKILIEQGIDGKEVECAVLDVGEPIASTVGEIQSAEEFYSYDAKYNNSESKTIIPAKIEKKQIEEIKRLAIKAFKTIDGRHLSRVDFFIEKETNKIYINEINTMPGFTQISMYPKLFEERDKLLCYYIHILIFLVCVILF